MKRFRIFAFSFKLRRYSKVIVHAGFSFQSSFTAAGLLTAHGRGVHPSTSHLNLSRLCHYYS
jgi:hypothetical protein